MSGSSGDTEVKITFGAVSTEFEASCRAAMAALTGLKGIVDSLTASAAATAAGLDRQTTAMTATRAAAAQVTEALKSTNTATTQTASAVRDLVEATTGVSRAQKDAAASAATFMSAMGGAETATKSASGSFREGATAATGLGHGTAGANREIIVLAHEMVQGNFSRIPGSLMVLGERMGGLSLQTLGWAAAIGGTVYAVYQLVSAWHQVEAAVRAAQGAQVVVGTWTEKSVEQSRGIMAAMRERLGLTRTEAAETVQLYAGMGGAAAKYVGRISEAGSALAKMKGVDVADTAKEVSKAFDGGAESALRWATANHIVDGTNAEAIRTMIAAGQQTEAMGVLLDRMDERFIQSGLKRAAAHKVQKDQIQELGMLGEGAAFTPPAMNPPDQREMAIGKPGTSAQDPDEVAQLELIQKINPIEKERNELIAQRVSLQKDADARIPGSADALAAVNEKIANLHTTTENQEHQATVARLQSDLIAAKESADKRLEVTRQMLAETMRFEGGNAQAVAAAQRQVQTAEQQAADATLRMTLAKIGEREAAARGDRTKLIALENEKLAAMEAAGKKGTLEYQNEINRRVAIQHQGADEGIKLAVDKLRGEQEAAQGDYTAQLAIQDRIVEMVRQHYGENTIQLQQELNKQIQLRQEAARQTATIAVQQLEGQRHLLDEQLRAAIQHIQAERQEGELSVSEAKSQQIAEIQAHADATARILADEERRAAGIRQLSEQVHRRQVELAQQTATAITQANDRAAEESHRAWVRTNQQIASSFAGEAVSILSGQRTVAQAIQGLGQRGVQWALEWAGKRALAWVEGEIAQTAATQAQAAIRATADGKAAPLQWAVLLANWLGIETGKTTATVAGSAARTGADTAANTLGTIEEKATAEIQVATLAGVAGAGAFAATAPIPIIGPELAPDVAAAAEAETLAFGQFAVGAWQLPSDQLAMVHKNESIVPATFAQGLRDNGFGLGGGGGGGGGAQVNFHVHAQDAASVAAFFNQHAHTLARTLTRHWRNTGSTRMAH